MVRLTTLYPRFHTFVDLCCKAFNTLRASGNLLLTLFSLMTSSGIPGLDKVGRGRKEVGE